MRRLRNIFAILALFTAASCAVDNVDTPSYGVNNSDVVTVIGRMTRFDEKDVTTRGVKNEAEAKLTSMAVAIFPVTTDDDGTVLLGTCAHWQFTKNQAELLFEINRSSIGFTPNARYAMYVFCNMPELEEGFGIGSSLESMLTTAQKVSGINIPENGFPMMGSLGDTFSTAFDKDNQILILSPTKNNLADGELLAPTVNGTTQTLLTIPMKAMYAKVNFSIEVRPDQTIEGHYSPQFELKGYTVNNVPSKVDFSNGTNSDSEVSDSDYTLGVSGSAVASGANKINFTFYLPERLLTADKNLDSVLPQELRKGTYSKDVDTDQNGYRDEDEVYHQRFKSKMLGDEQKATNIVISGEFRDHQNHYWNVDYTIYLGENNSTDFNIKRNSEYNNYVTIRGIQSSDDMSDNANGIAIDHRVNVERSQPAIISLRREVLLDSHFEVRPLRIRKSSVSDSNINAVKVEVLNPATTTWMRLERSAGEGSAYAGKTNASGESIYITDEGPSKGKRRYFTYNLVDGKTPGTYDYSLVNSTSVILPLTNETECCWIYVDECTEVGDAVRSGIVKVSYGSYDGKEFTPAKNSAYPDVNYVINQRKLFQVDNSGRKYNIEYEEEYLHNFDADDNYGQTEYEGMQWGLPGVQLSYDTQAMVFDDAWASDIVNGFVSRLSPYYDFYISTHDSVDGIVMRDEETGTLYPYLGQTFTSEIITTVNGGQKDSDGNAYDNNPDNNIDILTLGQNPKSAIEYCYNKNKRNADGHVIWQNTNGTYNQTQYNWYMPSINEIEDIMMSSYGQGLYTYARFIDFQNKFYWSSQPAFIRNVGHYVSPENDVTGEYYYDNKDNARATKVSYDGTYHTASSGMDGYYQAAYLRRPALNGTVNNPIYHDLPGSYQYIGYAWAIIIPYETTKTMSKYNDEKYRMKQHEGNLPRTSYARVRCVRK